MEDNYLNMQYIEMLLWLTYTKPLCVCHFCLRNGDVASKKLKLKNGHCQVASIDTIILVSCRFLKK